MLILILTLIVKYLMNMIYNKLLNIILVYHFSEILYYFDISMTHLPQRFKLNTLKAFIPGVPVRFSKLPSHPLSMQLLICLGADKPEWCVRLPLK